MSTLEKLEAELERQKKEFDDVYLVVRANERCHRRQMAGMKPGLYALTDQSEQHWFRAGSYSGYNWWRDQLSRHLLDAPAEEVWSWPDEFADKPFVELIDFTDCDGRIGSPVAGKLAKDFEDHLPRAIEIALKLDEGEYWLEVYRDFSKALALAGQNGALVFC